MGACRNHCKPARELLGTSKTGQQLSGVHGVHVDNNQEKPTTHISKTRGTAWNDLPGYSHSTATRADTGAVLHSWVMLSPPSPSRSPLCLRSLSGLCVQGRLRVNSSAQALWGKRKKKLSHVTEMECEGTEHTW